MSVKFTTRRSKNKNKYLKALYDKYRSYIIEGMQKMNEVGANYTDGFEYFYNNFKRASAEADTSTPFETLASRAVKRSASIRLIEEQEEKDLMKALKSQIKAAGYKAVQMRDEHGKFIKNGTYHRFDTSTGGGYWFNNGDTLIYAIRRNSPDDMGQWYDFYTYAAYKQMFDNGEL